MSAFDDIRRALTDAYGTNTVFDDLTAEDLIKAVIAEQRLDAENYPGELAMYRGLVRVLRTVVRENDTLDEVRRLLWEHAGDERDAAMGRARSAAPDEEIPPPAELAVHTNRRAHLLAEISKGGRWKSGTVARWYGEHGYTGLRVQAARHDLAVLRDSGAIVQHDEAGVRYFTAARQGVRRG
ncbi:hypothetical protein [Streptomyces parvulus]|uniref:hypothetical protein n=1 Tax=Streptomyces parvulus TaxID=146923 RepID=UPI0033B867BD